MKPHFLVLASVLFLAANAGADLITPIPILSPGLSFFIHPVFMAVAMVLNFIVNFLVFRYLCSKHIEKDYSKKTGKKFLAAILLITIAGAFADIGALLPVLVFPLAFILYPVFGFALIFCFDWLICTKYLKIEKPKAKSIATWMGISTNPFILLFVGGILGIFISAIFFNPIPSKTASMVMSASDTLKEAYQDQYLLVATRQSFASANGMAITRKEIIEKAGIGISENQLCLSLGEYSDSNSAFESGTSFIRYKQGGLRNATFSVLCVPGEEMLSQIGEDGSYPKIKDGWAENCECVQDPALQEQTCCLVMLKYAT
ncbi:MAG: hypothetical protein NT067_04285 [Candidatus Diapherotrites archaeon]|nr:hypothetical protein [Candidatus Diapherotrites archaeon]